jgi:hypothetical protein
MVILNTEASRPFDVPVIRLLLKRFCHTTARVHWGIMYGNINMELRYFLNFMFVLVIRKANTPPNSIDITQDITESSTVFRSGVQRLALASLLVNRST